MSGIDTLWSVAVDEVDVGRAITVEFHECLAHSIPRIDHL